MNNTLEGINSRIAEAEEQINDWEDRMVRITATGQNIKKKKKEKKRSEYRLGDFWDNIKHINIHIIRVPKGEERKDLRKYLKR